MKAFAVLIIFCFWAIGAKAGNPYRNYLLSEISPVHAHVIKTRASVNNPVLSSAAYIPRFERPKGAIFCRMEDKVTKVTGVWLKIGVQ